MGIVIRQSIKGTIVTYIGAFIGFLTTMFIVTKYIDSEIYGLTQVMIQAGTLLCGLAQLGIASSAIRFFPYFKDPEKKNNGFFFYLVTVPLIGFLILIPFFFFFRTSIESLYIEKSALLIDYFHWLIPLTFFMLYWTVFETYSNILMRVAVPKFIREVLVRLLMIVIYLLYAFEIVNLSEFVTGFVLIYGIAMCVCFFYISRIGTISLKHNYSYIQPSLKKKFITYTSTLTLGSLGLGLFNTIGLFIIGSELGLANAGIYQVAFFMANVIEIPSRSISAISAPLAADSLSKDDFHSANVLYKKVALHQFLIGCVAFLFIWINIDNIYAIIPNGETYQAGKWVIFYLGFTKIFTITLSFGDHLINFTKYFHWKIYFTFFNAIFAAYCNYLLIPHWGITGSAIATLISCITLYSLQQWLIFKKIKGNPFSMGIIKSAGIISVLILISYLLPELKNPWLDTLYQTGIVSIIGLFAVSKLHISPEIDSLIASCIRPLKRK